jgi:hypothetical protein
LVKSSYHVIQSKLEIHQQEAEMRYFSVVVAVLLCVTSAITGGKKSYGKGVTLTEVTKISDILDAPERYNGKRVLVEGNIVGVCEKRGCWIKIASDKEFQSITFKVDDGVIIFPLDAKGKRARAEGVVSVKQYTQEELIVSGKKHAEETNQTFDPAAVTGPKTVIQVKGEGAIVE